MKENFASTPASISTDLTSIFFEKSSLKTLRRFHQKLSSPSGVKHSARSESSAGPRDA